MRRQQESRETQFSTAFYNIQRYTYINFKNLSSRKKTWRWIMLEIGVQFLEVFGFSPYLCLTCFLAYYFLFPQAVCYTTTSSSAFLFIHSQASQRTLVGRQGLKCSFLIFFRVGEDEVLVRCQTQIFLHCNSGIGVQGILDPVLLSSHSFTGIGQTYCSCYLN